MRHAARPKPRALPQRAAFARGLAAALTFMLALAGAGCTTGPSGQAGIPPLLASSTLFAIPSDTLPPPTETAATVPLEAIDQAERLYAQAQFDLARPAFQALVARFPRNAYLWFRLGNCSAQLKHYAEAAQAFERARALDPSDGRFAYNLAFAHSALARDAFAQARAQLPQGSPWRQEAEQNRRLMEAVVGTPSPR